MNHVRVIKRAHHLRDRVCLTNIRQELIPQPLALRGTLHNTRNINERDSRGQNTLRPENLGEPVQAGIRQVHHTNIRLNRSERVVSRQHRVAGERVEQGGLAHVRKTDNADSQSHRKSFIHDDDNSPTTPSDTRRRHRQLTFYRAGSYSALKGEARASSPPDTRPPYPAILGFILYWAT